MAKYLDADGLQHYHESIQPSLVRGVTQAEYDALSEEEKRGLVVITDAQPSGGGGGSIGTCENVYSTEERRIGTWIDGKPIYRRVVIGTTLESDGDKYLFPDVDSLIFVHGNVEVNASGAKQMSIPWSMSVSDQVNVCISVNNQAMIRTAGGAWRDKPFQLVFEYTKTTDQPEATT